MDNEGRPKYFNSIHFKFPKIPTGAGGQALCVKLYRHPIVQMNRSTKKKTDNHLDLLAIEIIVKEEQSVVVYF